MRQKPQISNFFIFLKIGRTANIGIAFLHDKNGVEEWQIDFTCLLKLFLLNWKFEQYIHVAQKLKKNMKVYSEKVCSILHTSHLPAPITLLNMWLLCCFLGGTLPKFLYVSISNFDYMVWSSPLYLKRSISYVNLYPLARALIPKFAPPISCLWIHALLASSYIRNP